MVSGPLKELLNYTTGISFEGFAAAESESVCLPAYLCVCLSVFVCLSVYLSLTL